MKFKDYTQEQKEKYIKAAKFLEIYLQKGYGYISHLGFGSLLGAVREGKLIDSDYDIDLCVILPSEDTEKHATKLFNQLIKKRWLKRIFDKDQNYLDNPRQAKNILGQAHIHIAGCVIDLFVAWQKDGKYYTCQWGEIGKANGHTVLQLEDQIFKAPSDYDNILTTLYGDWRTPSDDHPSKRLIRKCYFE
jgi:phosphorylcholine metabolism protein LicD